MFYGVYFEHSMNQQGMQCAVYNSIDGSDERECGNQY